MAFLITYMQDHKGISNAASADCPLFPLPVQKIGNNSDISGSPKNQVVTEERIHDSICNLRFCISPTAFFQVRMELMVFFMRFPLLKNTITKKNTGEYSCCREIVLPCWRLGKTESRHTAI